MKRFDPLLFLVALFLGSSCTVYPNPNIGKALHIGDEVLKDYHPMTTLVTEKHLISKAKYPVVDVHTHFGLDQNPEAILGSMDALGVKRVVNLSGGWGEKLNKILRKFKNYAPERFIIMCNIDFSRIDETDFGKKCRHS